MNKELSYAETWRFLDNLQFFKIKLGLDSMTDFLGRLGHPEDNLRFIHIGGTNGKGSTAMSLRAILSRAKLKVGLYTSPHLSSVRERFQINDALISEEDFARHAARIMAVMNDQQITYFEFTTTLALLWFAEQKVDLAILEVGMGGRLDATNVITPLITIITNVSMDHENYLGRTLPKVAAEKAGIIKSGVPLISGVLSPAAREVIERRAAALAAPLRRLKRDFTMSQDGTGTGWRYKSESRDMEGLELALRGSYQGGNAALAIAALDGLAAHGIRVDDEDIRAGLKTVRWPGRMEFLNVAGQDYLLDGAHNPAGVEALIEALADFSDHRLIMIWASMADKDYSLCLKRIAPFCQSLIFARPEENRSATPAQLRKALGPDSPPSYSSDSVDEALKTAQSFTQAGDLIVVAGSLYLVGKVREILSGPVTGKKTNG
ncbi:MAG TPA: bifunctional folylpolyglutamate synthase/dihydrofolate synthase [Desulfobacterales bacterium]|nr:bifunctional folylpolyglutamate synthase/dihydrofolate synthase [Desulfobacterales bacterium]